MTKETFDLRSGIIPIEFIKQRPDSVANQISPIDLQNDTYSPALLQYEIKTYLKISQYELAKRLKVSAVAVSRAINDDPALRSVRERIIQKIQKRKKAA